MRKRPTWDEYFLNITDVISTRSHDDETQVGCVLVTSDKRIISTGYNGFPPGFDDETLPTTRPEKYEYMVHAEANAISFAKNDLKNCTLYCTLTPCTDCVKLILTSGITRIVCKRSYVGWHNVEKMLKMGNVEIKLINDAIYIGEK